MTGRSSARHLGGVLLLLLWSQVGTGNALACALSCLRVPAAPTADHGAVHPAAASHPRHHGRAVAPRGSCGTVQSLGLVYAAPALTATPEARAAIPVRQAAPVSAAPSFVPTLATPPPRA